MKQFSLPYSLTRQGVNSEYFTKNAFQRLSCVITQMQPKLEQASPDFRGSCVESLAS